MFQAPFLEDFISQTGKADDLRPEKSLSNRTFGQVPFGTIRRLVRDKEQGLAAGISAGLYLTITLRRFAASRLAQ